MHRLAHTCSRCQNGPQDPRFTLVCTLPLRFRMASAEAAFLLAAMAGAPATSLTQCVLRALVRADCAGLCNDADLQRMAAVVAESLHARRVEHSSSKCPECGSALRRFPQRALPAWVLDVGGLQSYRHTPKRCRARGCALRDRTIWCNFVGFLEKKNTNQYLPIHGQSPWFSVILQSYYLQFGYSTLNRPLYIDAEKKQTNQN